MKSATELKDTAQKQSARSAERARAAKAEVLRKRDADIEQIAVYFYNDLLKGVEPTLNNAANNGKFAMTFGEFQETRITYGAWREYGASEYNAGRVEALKKLKGYLMAYGYVVELVHREGVNVPDYGYEEPRWWLNIEWHQ